LYLYAAQEEQIFTSRIKTQWRKTMQFVPADMLSKIGSLSRMQADGVIELYNKYEAELAGVAPTAAEGKNFFTQVAPCTNNRLFFGRFKDGIAAGALNVALPYTFTYKMKPTNVVIHLYHDAASKTNWVFVKKR
jgi:photoactive yellow protein